MLSPFTAANFPSRTRQVTSVPWTVLANSLAASSSGMRFFMAQVVMYLRDDPRFQDLLLRMNLEH